MNGKVLHIAGKLSFTETHFSTKILPFLLQQIFDFFFACKTRQLKNFDQWFLVFAINFPIFYITKKS